MILYEIIVPESFGEKFENFINNVNIVNSKKMVKIINKKKIVAIPKGENDDIDT